MVSSRIHVLGQIPDPCTAPARSPCAFERPVRVESLLELADGVVESAVSICSADPGRYSSEMRADPGPVRVAFPGRRPHPPFGRKPRNAIKRSALQQSPIQSMARRNSRSRAPASNSNTCVHVSSDRAAASAIVQRPAHVRAASRAWASLIGRQRAEESDPDVRIGQSCPAAAYLGSRATAARK